MLPGKFRNSIRERQSWSALERIGAEAEHEGRCRKFSLEQAVEMRESNSGWGLVVAGLVWKDS